MKERLIIIFVALIAGLFITSAGFFIYQSTKKDTTKETSSKTAKSDLPTVTPNRNLVGLQIIEPNDESITTNRSVTVKGKTTANNTVIVSTNLQDTTGQADAEGNFSIDVDISTGANILITRSVAQNGDSSEDSRTVTYSTEEF